ncbi:hypothetical protein ma397 [Moumouvirus australiensis]|uniref:Uncharacterized protein n=1 Tax=Moumouvirus australiensis TaxID=2109587 RepID=A0A2P1ELM0_9VIRU|nr:hypothetical protein QKC55_gp508 [Moumouvirus australiensis]AVL94783.1 hypothetical protein ma397 [Moumouvirus australiensis]
MSLFIIKMNNNPDEKPDNYKILFSDTNFVGTNILMNTIFTCKKTPQAEQMLQDSHERQKQIQKDFNKYIKN